MIPEPDGFEVCRTLRAEGRWTPVLLLTARDAVDDRVLGLDAGADDYLTKPFAFTELFARLRALTRRDLGARPTVLAVGDLVLDPATRQVPQGRHRHLLVDQAVRHPRAVHAPPRERCLSRADLLEHVWDFAYEGTSNLVDVYVRTCGSASTGPSASTASRRSGGRATGCGRHFLKRPHWPVSLRGRLALLFTVGSVVHPHPGRRPHLPRPRRRAAADDQQQPGRPGRRHRGRRRRRADRDPPGGGLRPDPRARGRRWSDSSAPGPAVLTAEEVAEAVRPRRLPRPAHPDRPGARPPGPAAGPPGAVRRPDAGGRGRGVVGRRDPGPGTAGADPGAAQPARWAASCRPGVGCWPVRRCGPSGG